MPQRGPETERLPSGAAFGGYAGLLPFAGAAAAAWWPPLTAIALATLQAYAVVILAFVGAVHWGIAVGRPELPGRDARILASVVPALLAWPLSLLPAGVALPGLVAAFGGVWLAERSVGLGGLPGWYARLRTQLTIGAVAMLVLGWAAGP